MKHIFDIFEHLIETLEDDNVDPLVIDMVNDALKAFTEYLEENDELEE